VTFFIGAIDQALVEGIVFGHVGDCDAQHVVDIARHSVGFDDFRHGADPEAEPSTVPAYARRL
jgi:hypothetical protein